MTVYVKDGKEISPQEWIEYVDPLVASTLSCQPMFMTAYQMALAAVTTTVEQPMPDEFYGPVQKDPNNPGGWIQTPHSPEEMQARLHDYSASIRSSIEIGGMVMANGLATPTTRDVRAMYTTGSHNSNKKELLLTAKLYPIVDGMPSSVPIFVKMSKKELDQMDMDLTEFADQCIVVEASTSDQIRAGTITTKEEIAAAYESLRQRSPRMAPRAI
jgi:hypothetical protein